MRISDEILVIGYVLDLQKYERLLKNDIEAGIITEEKRHLLGIEEKTYEI